MNSVGRRCTAILAPVLLGMVAAAATARPKLPSFADFAVPVSPIPKPAAVQLNDARARHYATLLKDSEMDAPNFAGHFALASWGCGASCIMAAAIDGDTGAVTWLPFTVCCWETEIIEPLEFQPNSRLLIVHGQRDERGAGGTHFYRFTGTRFEALR